MTEERDSTLQSLFAIASKDPADDAFTDNVMARIDRLRRRAVVGWSGVGLALLICAWLVAAPLQGAVPLVTQALPWATVDIDNSQIARVFAPVNSIGGIVVLALLGLRLAYRKLLR